jgi:hypothetical protein
LTEGILLAEMLLGPAGSYTKLGFGIYSQRELKAYDQQQNQPYDTSSLAVWLASSPTVYLNVNKITAAPTFTAITPNQVPPSGWIQVRVTGKNFSPGGQVRVFYTTREGTFLSANLILANSIGNVSATANIATHGGQTYTVWMTDLLSGLSSNTLPFIVTGGIPSSFTNVSQPQPYQVFKAVIVATDKTGYFSGETLEWAVTGLAGTSGGALASVFILGITPTSSSPGVRYTGEIDVGGTAVGAISLAGLPNGTYLLAFTLGGYQPAPNSTPFVQFTIGPVLTGPPIINPVLKISPTTANQGVYQLPIVMTATGLTPYGKINFSVNMPGGTIPGKGHLPSYNHVWGFGTADAIGNCTFVWGISAEANATWSFYLIDSSGQVSNTVQVIIGSGS